MKLPFLQFYPSDYMRDTRALSLAAKGGWVDVMCMLHGSSTRGTMKLPVIGWARVMGASVDQANAVIDELQIMRVCEVIREGNDDVTISSRRMLRESITREQTRLRVERFRSNPAGNGDGNAPVTGQKAETRNQKPETNIPDSLSPSGVEKTHEKTEVQLKIDAFFKRRVTTPWGPNELRALSKNRLVIEATTPEEWELLAKWFALPQQETYSRKDAATLMNNWNTEISRAKAGPNAPRDNGKRSPFADRP